jgi:outer membrane receptor for ferrienterochelin and colicins
MRVEQEDFGQDLSKTELLAGEVATTSVAEVDPVTLRSVSGYGQLGWNFGDEFTLLPGLRGEWHERFGGVVAPRLAAAYRPGPSWIVRASVGRGFRAPSAKEYGFLFDHSFLGYRLVGNSELAPERSWGVSADVSVPLSDGVRLRVAGFRNWIDSLIGLEFSGRAVPGVDDYRYVNVGTATTLGGDASVEFRITQKLRSQLAYSYLFTRNEDTGEPLPSRPAHTVLSALSYQPSGGLEFTLRNRLVSSAYVAEGLTAPGFVKLDLRASQRLSEYFSAYVGVLNALDARDDPARPGDQRPLVGRLYTIGLNASYEEGM